MQDFILSATWTATAGIVATVCFLLAMVCGGTVMYVVLKGYYWMKVQQERMAVASEEDIKRLKSEPELERIAR